MRTSRCRVGVTVAISCSLLLTACSGSADEKAAPTPTRTTASPTPTTPSPTPTPTPVAHHPLTGLTAKRGVPARSALVIKVDNTGSAAPQRGLGTADLIVEELVEGGRTRLAVMFQSRLPSVVGPIRSMRTSDIGIVKPTRGVLVASGAAGVVRRAVRRADIRSAHEGAPGTYRESGRSAPYNLMVRPRPLARSFFRRRPPDYLGWARPSDTLPRGRSVSQAAVRFSPFQTTRWRYGSDRAWHRTNGPDAAGDRFRARNVLVLSVRTRDAGYRDPAGSFVPETVTTGTGRALLLTGGRAIQLTWHKASARRPWWFTKADGRAVRIPRGHTWIELVPRDGRYSAF